MVAWLRPLILPPSSATFVIYEMSIAKERKTAGGPLDQGIRDHGTTGLRTAGPGEKADIGNVESRKREAESGRRKAVGEGSEGGMGERSVEPYVTRLVVAERMGADVRTVTRLMRRGVLRYYKVGAMVRFKWSEVEEDLRRYFRVKG